jgi:hypothetical protein
MRLASIPVIYHTCRTVLSRFRTHSRRHDRDAPTTKSHVFDPDFTIRSDGVPVTFPIARRIEATTYRAQKINSPLRIAGIGGQLRRILFSQLGWDAN